MKRMKLEFSAILLRAMQIMLFSIIVAKAGVDDSENLARAMREVDFADLPAGTSDHCNEIAANFVVTPLDERECSPTSRCNTSIYALSCNGRSVSEARLAREYRYVKACHHEGFAPPSLVDPSCGPGLCPNGTRPSYKLDGVVRASNVRAGICDYDFNEWLLCGGKEASGTRGAVKLKGQSNCWSPRRSDLATSGDNDGDFYLADDDDEEEEDGEWDALFDGRRAVASKSNWSSEVAWWLIAAIVAVALLCLIRAL